AMLALSQPRSTRSADRLGGSAKHVILARMAFRGGRVLRGVPAGIGILTLSSLVALLLWDAAPRLFPATAHDVLAAVPLASIAVAYLAYQALHRPTAGEFAKAVLLSLAFVFWAANQLWPASPLATFYNDVAIAAFVVDVFLVIARQRAATA